jgi:hypothetical protein
LLFCLVIHPVLTQVAKQAVTEFPDLTVEGEFKIFIFYLDHGYVVAKKAVLIRLGELVAPHGTSWMSSLTRHFLVPGFLFDHRCWSTRSLAVFHVIYITWRTTLERTST